MDEALKGATADCRSTGAIRRIAVTGASGFIGGHVCAVLVHRGYHVRALVRRPGWVTPGAEARVVGDLCDRRLVQLALEGVDAVIHLAGRAHILGDRSRAALEEFRRVNVEGTRACAEAAVAAGAISFVLASSVGAVAASNAGRLDERAAPRPNTAYGQSKLEAELVLRQIARTSGLRAPVLRPPMVYGPGMRGNSLRLFHLVASGLPIPLGAVRNRRSVMYVGNLVQAIEAVLQCPEAGAESFFISDGEDVSTPDFVRRVGRAVGKPARLVRVPIPLLRAAGAFGDVISRFTRFPLTSAALDGLVGTLVVDDTNFRRVSGFVPPYTIDEGLRLTAEWFNEHTAQRRRTVRASRAAS
jgi:nucleoside-diphosphate-sugar epimerase